MPEVKASEALKSLQEFLSNLFQFESADLDFGIYKILHYKKTGLDFKNDRDFIRENLMGNAYDLRYANNQCAIEGATMIEDVFTNNMNLFF